MSAVIEITDNVDVPIPAGALNFGAITRLIASAIVTIRIWNNRLAPFTATTAKGLLMFPEVRPTALDPYLASGYEFCDAQALWWRLNGVVSDPTGGTSGGRPEDYVPVTTDWRPCGGKAFALLPNLPPQFAREVELRVLINVTGGPLPIAGLKIGLLVDNAVYGRDVFSEQCEGNASIMRWERSRNVIATGVGYVAAQISESPITPNAPVLQHVTYKIAGWPVKVGVVELPALSNLDGDVPPVAMIANQTYCAVITKDLDRDFTATGYTVTKSVRATLPTIPTKPTPPAGIVIGYVTRVADADGGGLISIEDRQRHDDGHLRIVGAAGGLAVPVGMRMETINGIVNAEDGESSVTTTAVAARYNIIQTPGKALSAVAAGTAISPNYSVIGSATNDGVDVIAGDDRKIGRAPNLWLTRRRHMTWFGDMANAQDLNGLYPAFGTLEVRNAAGALPQTIIAPGGHRAYARVTTFGAYGTLRFGVAPNNIAVSVGDWGGGAALAQTATAEDHIIDKVDDWIVTRARWGGTGANSPDLNIAATVGLVGTQVESGIVQPFQNHGLMFQVCGVVLKFIPTATTATLQFTVKKVPARGTVATIIDTGPLSAFDGAGGAGTNVGRWMTRELFEMPDGTTLEGLIEEPDHDAIIHPLVGGEGDMPWDGGEGIIAYFSNTADVQCAEATLFWYDLITQ